MWGQTLTAPTRWAFALAACAAFALLWWAWPTPEPAPGETIKLPPAHEQIEAGQMIEHTPSRPIKTVPAKAKKALSLPEAVQANPDQYVLTTATIRGDDRYTLTTVLDDQTGESTIYARRDPAPWLAVDPRITVGVAYGLNERGNQAGLLHARADLLQVRDGRIGALATIDTTGRAFAGLNLEWRLH